MNIFPEIIVLLGPVLFLFALDDLPRAYSLSCASLVLSASAVMNASGANILIEQAVFSLFIGFWFLSFLRQGRRSHPLEVESGVYILLSLYVFLSAILLPRIFQNNLYVFSPVDLSGGVLYEKGLPLRLVPLRPNFGNISQSLYLIFAGLYFAFAVRMGRHYGAALIERGLFAAAWMLIVLGLLDIVGLDPFLDVLRTASYKINDDQTVGGFDRSIGATSEASRFGFVSVVLLAYFMASWLYRRHRATGWTAWLLLIVCLSSFSSTAFLGIASLAMILLWRGARFYKGNHKILLRTVSLIIGCTIFVLLAIMFSGLGADIMAALRGLTVGKADSESGRIRTILALKSFDILRETFGFGSGAGAATANGILFVWFANIGVPGALLFSIFYFTLLQHPGQFDNLEMTRIWFSATTAIMVYLITEGLGRTLLDPGLLVMTIGAAAASSRAPRWVLRRKRAQYAHQKDFLCCGNRPEW